MLAHGRFAGEIDGRAFGQVTVKCGARQIPCGEASALVGLAPGIGVGRGEDSRTVRRIPNDDDVRPGHLCHDLKGTQAPEGPGDREELIPFNACAVASFAASKASASACSHSKMKRSPGSSHRMIVNVVGPRTLAAPAFLVIRLMRACVRLCFRAMLLKLSPATTAATISALHFGLEVGPQIPGWNQKPRPMTGRGESA